MCKNCYFRLLKLSSFLNFMKMRQLIEKFIEQLVDGIRIGEEHKLNGNFDQPRNLLICGMGGSGIGGDFVASYLSLNASIPVVVSKGYSIPSYVNKDTLVIISSYSGNTEESLEALNESMKKGARVACVTSGGSLLKTAKDKDLELILLPGDWPSPRACLGYSLIAQLYLVYSFGIIDASFKNELDNTIKLLKESKDQIQTEAMEIARRLIHKTPVIYGDKELEPVMLRFRQQLNENAKMLAWHNTIPEMNHNELVGWTQKQNDKAIVFFRNDVEHPKVSNRISIIKEILIEYVDVMIEIKSRGNSFLERSIYLVHLVDWVSWYIADELDVDADEIRVIDFLKEQLA